MVAWLVSLFPIFAAAQRNGLAAELRHQWPVVVYFPGSEGSVLGPSSRTLQPCRLARRVQAVLSTQYSPLGTLPLHLGLCCAVFSVVLESDDSGFLALFH